MDRHVDHTHASPSYYEHVHQTLTYPLTNPAHAHTRPTVFTDLSVTITVRLTGFETVTGTTRTSTCYWDTATLTECVVFRGITEGVHRRRRAVEPSAVQEKSVPFYRRPDRVVTNVFFSLFLVFRMEATAAPPPLAEVAEVELRSTMETTADDGLPLVRSADETSVVDLGTITWTVVRQNIYTGSTLIFPTVTESVDTDCYAPGYTVSCEVV